MRFLSIGECMAELAPGDGSGQFRLGYAGDTFNTAWYLRALRPDIDTAYFSAIGTDALSDQMLAMMTGAGIDTAHVTRLPDRTVGLYLISLTNGERSFSYWRNASAARTLADDPARLAGAMAGADAVYVSGITLAILDPAGRKTLLAALGTARAAGKTTIFDPNLRPRLWQDNAEMTRTVMQAAATSAIVLPSFEDEATHFADPDPAATAARYLRAGAETVIVKNGAEPVLYHHAGAAGQVAVPAAPRIVDTTSAGDSFNAGFLADIDRPAPIADRIARASAVAAQVIAGKGALVPLDLTRLQP